MDPIKISTAQFENRSGDKAYNLAVIDKLAGQAAAEGSQVITFHECSITGYTFARKLSNEELLTISERIPEGESVQELIAIFSNPIGMDDDQLKNGCSMIIDPFGDVLAECRSFEDSFVTATIYPQKLTDAGESRYIKARRPELYKDIIGQSHQAEQKVAWLKS